jgi:hypothetical protein
MDDERVAGFAQQFLAAGRTAGEDQPRGLRECHADRARAAFKRNTGFRTGD